jgi:hypothetical protein
MGKSDRRALMSLLTRLIEHLLKLAYWQEEKNGQVIIRQQ